MDDAATGVIVVRAWLEPAAEPRLRVSIVEVRPGKEDHRLLACTAPAAVCEAVYKWVADFERRAGLQGQ
jgi:hypothetical protein